MTTLPPNPTPTRVLLVEDDPLQAEVCTAILEDAGFEVRWFADGHQALDCLLVEPYDLIVADFDMPVMDGLAFLRQAARIAPSAARLMLTATHNFDVAVGAINEGRVFRFLSKPVVPARLQMLVRLAHERQRLDSEVQTLRSSARDVEGLMDRVARTLTPDPRSPSG